jgi:galactitol-specific phosphotransferase system IIC component
MTWQLLIWNIFVWTFTGVMIYLTQSSLWWLLIPALFTGTQNAAEIVRGLKEENSEESYELDDETRAKMQALLEKFKRGQL